MDLEPRGAVVARRAHNAEDVGSIPSPATHPRLSKRAVYRKRLVRGVFIGWWTPYLTRREHDRGLRLARWQRIA
jgi:hypothetical protein